MADQADAQPTKRFFLEMITRDISLEDAILDLIDNSIDALMRTRDIEILQITSSLLKPNESVDRQEASVEVTIDEKTVSISDNCGGIDYKSAKEEVFRFGRISHRERSSLSVYGIGLKRAIFKIGRKITIQSKTLNCGFKVTINVDEWAKESTPWSFPIEQLPAARSRKKAGTKIIITELNPEVKMRIRDGKISGVLSKSIGQSYALFLHKFVRICVNDHPIRSQQITVGASEEVTPSSFTFEESGVQVAIITGLAERVAGKWNAERAGWYVLCNGRAVVFADKTEMTEWGLRLPRFVSKYRGFIGIVLFFSQDPEKLPWTTTKRGLNQESAILQIARSKMATQAKPVISFLNNMYPSDDLEEIEEREIAEKVASVDVRSLVSANRRDFSVSPSRRPARSTVTVQFKAKRDDISRAKVAIGQRTMSAGKVGEHAFEYFLKNECSE